jgi:hypothetical protein
MKEVKELMTTAVARLAVVCLSLIVIGLMLTSISNAQPEPVATYSFEGDVTDSSGGFDAEIMGDPQFVPGISGQALEFDGVDDYVLTPALPIRMGQPFTVSLWVKPSDPVTGCFIHISSQADGAGWCTPLIGVDADDKPAFYTHNMPKAVSQTTLAPNEWVFLAGVHTGDKSLIYVYANNEMSVAESSGGVSDSNSDKHLSFAKNSHC